MTRTKRLVGPQKALVDRQVYALAESFLADVKADRKQPDDVMYLAVEIQMAIEDYLAIVEGRPPRVIEGGLA